MEFAPDPKARLYTLVHQGIPGDVEYYVAAARGRRSLLELGAGAARILSAVAPYVGTAVGIERWEGMIAEADPLPDNATLVLGDACNFRLNAKFDTVFVPYNTLFALGGPEYIVDALRCARQHATKDALLIMDCYQLTDEDDQLLLPVEEEVIASIIDNGKRIQVYEREEQLPHPRAFRMVYRYDIAIPSGERHTLEDSIDHYWVPPCDLARLLASAGWRLDRLEAAFEHRALEDDDPHIVVRGSAVG